MSSIKKHLVPSPLPTFASFTTAYGTPIRLIATDYFSSSYVFYYSLTSISLTPTLAFLPDLSHSSHILQFCIVRQTACLFWRLDFLLCPITSMLTVLAFCRTGGRDASGYLKDPRSHMAYVSLVIHQCSLDTADTVLFLMSHIPKHSYLHGSYPISEL